MSVSLARRWSIHGLVVGVGCGLVSLLNLSQHLATITALFMIPFIKMAQAGWISASASEAITQGISWLGLQFVMHPHLTHIMLALLVVPPLVNYVGCCLTGRKHLIPTLFDLLTHKNVEHALSPESGHKETPQSRVLSQEALEAAQNKPFVVSVPEHHTTLQDLTEGPGYESRQRRERTTENVL